MPQDCYLHNAGKILHLESLQDLNQKMQGVRFFFFFNLKMPAWFSSSVLLETKA